MTDSTPAYINIVSNPDAWPSSYVLFTFAGPTHAYPVWYRIWTIASLPYELLRFLYSGNLRIGYVRGYWSKKLYEDMYGRTRR